MSQTATDPALHLTPSAVRQLGEFALRHGKHVRLEINPGGCSGFDLRFAEGEPKPDDARFGPEGHELLVDPVSLGLIAGATVDYAEQIGKDGFTSDKSPKREARCGCGTSFSLAD